MAKRILYNHKSSIKGKQPSPFKAIQPGMFCTFTYGGDNVTDILQ